MKRARFREERIAVLKEEHETGSRRPIWPGLHGISEATFYKWKAMAGWTSLRPDG